MAIRSAIARGTRHWASASRRVARKSPSHALATRSAGCGTGTARCTSVAGPLPHVRTSPRAFCRRALGFCDTLSGRAFRGTIDGLPLLVAGDLVGVLEVADREVAVFGDLAPALLGADLPAVRRASW